MHAARSGKMEKTCRKTREKLLEYKLIFVGQFEREFGEDFGGHLKSQYLKETCMFENSQHASCIGGSGGYLIFRPTHAGVNFPFKPACNA